MGIFPNFRGENKYLKPPPRNVYLFAFTLWVPQLLQQKGHENKKYSYDSFHPNQDI